MGSHADTPNTDQDLLSIQNELLSGIQKGRCFANFQEVEKLYADLRDICFFPVCYKERRTVESHNKMVMKIL